MAEELGVGEGGEGHEVPQDLEELKSLLRGLPENPNRIVSIPVWGFTAAGKTCSLLTLMHYLQVGTHGIGLALPKDTDELEAIQSAVPEYSKGAADFVNVARSTTPRLMRLRETFIDQCEWPPGTDEPHPYILRIQGRGLRTLGYLFVPDLPGGNYEECSAVSRKVLGEAHGCAVLVDPDRYHGDSTAGRSYLDDIACRLQACLELELPTVVMITKSDLHPEPRSPADSVHQHLEMLLDGARNKSLARIVRVSVIGERSPEVGGGKSTLPRSAERKPARLLDAWVWLLSTVLRQSDDVIRKRVPSANLQGVAASDRSSLVADAIPELRPSGEFSNAPQLVICPLDDNLRGCRFACLEAGGKVIEATFPHSGDKPDCREVGAIAGLDGNLEDLVGTYVDGHLLMGSRRSPQAIWRGAFGDLIQKTPLPHEVLSWSALSADTLITIDKAGRLHLLAYREGRWKPEDYIENLLPAAEISFCAALGRERLALAFNGQTAEAVEILPNARFGARRTVPMKPAFDSTHAVLAPSSVFAAVLTNGTVLAHTSTTTFQSGDALTEPSLVCAGNARPLLAYVDEELRVRLVNMKPNPAVQAEPSHSPEAPASPTSLSWSATDQVLVVVGSEGTWASYRPLGVPR